LALPLIACFFVVRPVKRILTILQVKKREEVGKNEKQMLMINERYPIYLLTQVNLC